MLLALLWVGTSLGLESAKAALGRGRKGLERAIAAVASELLPWLLGYGDPVRTRVQARQGKIKITPDDIAP